MDRETPDADALTFARALYAWMGAGAAGYADERAAAFRKAGDLPAAAAWSGVAGAIRGLGPARPSRRATALRSSGAAKANK